MREKACTHFFLRLLKPVVLKKQSKVSHPAPVQGQSQAPGVNSNGVRYLEGNCLEVESDFFLLRCNWNFLTNNNAATNIL